MHWKAGDLALCVNDKNINTGLDWCDKYDNPDGYPQLGKIYRVLRVEIDNDEDRQPSIIEYLHLEDSPMNHDFCYLEDEPYNEDFHEWVPVGNKWGSIRFIKVTPTEEDEFDSEIIDMMRGIELV